MMKTETAPTAYTLPGREESGEGYTYEHTYEILAVLDGNAGPCATCDKPLVRLDAKQHVVHNGYRYSMRFDFLYTHRDGTDPHTGIREETRPRGRCTKCSAYAVTAKQEAYGDRTICAACGHQEFHSIGD